MASRALAAGERLPSIRSFAATMRVSPSTVVEAYDRLAAEGVIRARRGLRLLRRRAPLPPLALAEVEPRRDRAIDPLLGVAPVARCRPRRCSSPAAAGCRPTGCRTPRCAGRSARSPGPTTPCSPTTAARAARSRCAGCCSRQFAERGHRGRRRPDPADRSGTQAIDLICRFLLRPGDTVLVDDPCYFNFQALLRAHRVEDRRRALHADRTGPVALRGAARGAPTAPLHHQFGAPQSDRRDAVAADRAPAAERRGRARPDHRRGRHLRRFRARALAAARRARRARPASSASAASPRRCRPRSAAATSPRAPDWIEALVDLQVATSFGGPSPVAAELVVRRLGDGSYRKHLERCGSAWRGRAARPARSSRRSASGPG